MNDKELIEYYRQRAPEYEQIYYRDVPDRRREIDDEAVFLRQVAADKTVLDIACGTGYWTQIAAETAGSVIACDISAEMLREAGRKEYHTRPSFVRADLRHLPFAAGQVDLVLLGFWLSHHPSQDYHSLFAELKRLPGPSGLIWMIDNNPPAEGPQQHSLGKDEHGNNYKRRYLDDGREYTILKNYFDRDELEGIVSPYFSVKRFVYKRHYWSLLLGLHEGS